MPSKKELIMQKLIYIISFLNVCIFQVVWGGACVASSGVNELAPASFIGKMVNESLGIVNNSGSSDDKKRKELSNSINKYLDIDRIASAVFSPKGYKDLSDKAQQRVKESLTKYLIRFYASEGKLSAMMNSKLSGEPVAERKNEQDFAVTTQFEKNSSPALKIVWITDGKKVFYVEIEGINQIITLRSEMDTAIGSRTLMEYINEQGF